MTVYIELKHDVIVGQEHGMFEGKVFEALEFVPALRSRQIGHDKPEDVWVMGNAGERVRVLHREYRVLKGDTS